MLDEWQEIENPKDGNFSEEFLISTVEVTNENNTNEEGLSKTKLPTGETITLSRLIAKDYKKFLGDKYAYEKDVRVAARVGDTIVRHVLQCHPDTEFAKKNLNFPNGKAEAWYIVKTREIDGQKPCIYAGFKPGVTREKWTELFEKQDIPAMLECMHKFDIHEGGVYFVDAGMPHCLGPGSVFLEIHEPCDYTFRVEKNYLPDKIFSDYEMNYGLGMDKLMDCFHYDTYTREEILKKCILDSTTIFKTKNASAETIVSYDQAKRFKVEKYTFTEPVTIPDFDGHRIAVTVKGSTSFDVEDHKALAKQGRGIFLPYNAKSITLTPVDGECTVVLCYPQINKELNPKEIFSNTIQIGVIVKDLDRYLEKLEKVFGMGCFRINEYPPMGSHPFMEYRGKEGKFRAKFCFYSLGNIELELIQPLEGESIWQEYIDKHGEGIQHVKFLIKNHKEVENYLNSNGFKIYQQGQGVGPNSGRVWAFYDTYEDIGFDVELMNE